MKKFAPTKNRTSLVSTDVFDKHLVQLSWRSYHLLLGLAQSIDHQLKLLPEIYVEFDSICDFLDIRHREDRWTIVREALDEITDNSLKIYNKDKKWHSTPWLSHKYDSENSSKIKIVFHPDITEYLVTFSRYINLKGVDYLALKNDYATLLYPYFKTILQVHGGVKEDSIERWKEITNANIPTLRTRINDKGKEESYYKTKFEGKNALTDFLRAIGLKRIKKSKDLEIVKGMPIDLVLSNTDILLSFKVVMNGRKFEAIKTTVKYKKNPPSKTSVQKIKGVGIPIHELHGLAGASKMSPQEYADRAGYRISGQYAYKINPPKVSKVVRKVRDQTQTELFDRKEITESDKTEISKIIETMKPDGYDSRKTKN